MVRASWLAQEKAKNCKLLVGMGDLQRDSRESFAIETPVFIARQADSPESLEFPIRANRANRFARIAPLRLQKNREK